MKRNEATRLIMAVIAFSIVFFNQLQIYIWYIKVLKKTELITHKNHNGQLEGPFMYFVKGNIDTRGVFTNGKKEGWVFKYYKDGKLKYKSYYKNNRQNGPDSQFYQTGILNYAGTRRNLKQYGSLKWYLENGAFDSYAVFDINGDSFCLLQYDSVGRLIKVDGSAASPIFYSIMNRDSTVIVGSMKNNKGISDLYITIATPPKTKQNISVKINDVTFKNLDIKNNTVTLFNVFKNKGIYFVSIKCSVTDEANKEILSFTIPKKTVKVIDCQIL